MSSWIARFFLTLLVRPREHRLRWTPPLAEDDECVFFNVPLHFTRITLTI
jgi:hypothetical protein